MKKIICLLLLMSIMTLSVYATPEKFSVRGDFDKGSEITKFSVWSNGENGQGAIVIKDAGYTVRVKLKQIGREGDTLIYEARLTLSTRVCNPKCRIYKEKMTMILEGEYDGGGIFRLGVDGHYINIPVRRLR